MSEDPATDGPGRDVPAEPVLPEVSTDERGEGWGDDADGRRDEQWYRCERPPHHE